MEKVVDAAVHGQKGKGLASVFLSEEQKLVLRLAEDGTSLFYTGSAGNYFWLFFLKKFLANVFPRQVLGNRFFCAKWSRG
jgi:hypothetical protein